MVHVILHSKESKAFMAKYFFASDSERNTEICKAQLQNSNEPPLKLGGTRVLYWMCI